MLVTDFLVPAYSWCWRFFDPSSVRDFPVLKGCADNIVYRLGQDAGAKKNVMSIDSLTRQDEEYFIKRNMWLTLEDFRKLYK